MGKGTNRKNNLEFHIGTTLIWYAVYRRWQEWQKL